MNPSVLTTQLQDYQCFGIFLPPCGFSGPSVFTSTHRKTSLLPPFLGNLQRAQIVPPSFKVWKQREPACSVLDTPWLRDLNTCFHKLIRTLWVCYSHFIDQTHPNHEYQCWNVVFFFSPNTKQMWVLKNVSSVLAAHNPSFPNSVQFSRSVVSDSLRPHGLCCDCVATLATARQASVSITNSRSLLKLVSVESVMSSNHLALCRPLLPPSIFPSIKVFSNESVLRFRCQGIGV